MATDIQTPGMIRQHQFDNAVSQSTVVLCIIGMDKVFQHHAHTFEKFDLNFHFQCEFSSVAAEW